MATGTIKKVVADRGFGFITAEDAKEYFFHRGGLADSARLRPPHRRREGQVRDRAEPQGPARDPGAARPDRPAPHDRRRPACVRAPGRVRPAADPAHPVGRPDRPPPARAPAPEYAIPNRIRFHLLPHRCGIATFTHDLRHVGGPDQVVALHPPSDQMPTRSRSITGSGATCLSDYHAVAGALTRSASTSSRSSTSTGSGAARTAATSSTSSGPSTCPSVTTLHTVLREPTPQPARHPHEPGRPLERDRRHVAVRGHDAEQRVRRRSAPARHRPARRAEPAARRTPTTSSRARPRGPAT